MIVQHIKTEKRYTLTAEAWAKIKALGKSDAYNIVNAPEKPKELKPVRASKKDKNAESDIDGITNIDDRLPGEDAREVE